MYKNTIKLLEQFEHFIVLLSDILSDTYMYGIVK